MRYRIFTIPVNIMFVVFPTQISAIDHSCLHHTRILKTNLPTLSTGLRVDGEIKISIFNMNYVS